MGGDGGTNRGSSAATVGATLFTVVSAVLVAVGNGTEHYCELDYLSIMVRSHYY